MKRFFSFAAPRKLETNSRPVGPATRDDGARHPRSSETIAQEVKRVSFVVPLL